VSKAQIDSVNKNNLRVQGSNILLEEGTMNFFSTLLSRKKSKAGGREQKQPAESRYGKPTDSVGFCPTVRCKKMGHFYDFERTYKENGLLDRPRCTGCGKLFDYDGDEDHFVFSIK
jgi:hypothetical protein